MFALVWWNYPLIAATTLGSMLLAYAWVDWKERGEGDANGPRPCLEHLGTSPHGFEEWCFGKAGHNGPHDGPQGPDEELRLFPEGAAPADTSFPPGLCQHGEDGGQNVDACWKEAGHDGPHLIVSSNEF